MSLIARQDTYQVTVSIAGDDLGVWTSRKGGSVDSEETKIKPGGMLPEVSLGGSRSTENVTLEKVFDLDDIGTKHAWLISKVGSGDVSITQQPLDRDGNVYGTAWSYTGTLKSATLPEYDANGNDASMIEIEVTISGDPS